MPPDWDSLSIIQKTELVKDLFSELLELEKNIGKEPKLLYNQLTRKKELKTLIKNLPIFDSGDPALSEFKKNEHSNNHGIQILTSTPRVRAI